MESLPQKKVAVRSAYDRARRILFGIGRSKKNCTAVHSDGSIDDPSWFYYKYTTNGSIIGPSGTSFGDYETPNPPTLATSTMKYLPDRTNIIYVVIFFVFIVVTIVGNTLVITAVITTNRLRSVTNCFVSSLAAADLMVGLAVMPPAVLLYINDGNWKLGEILCDAWVSLDVLLCTASILSLCAISIDRYLAVTQPLVYSKRRRSKKLAGLMIIAVWSLAGIITSPPLLGYFPRAISSDIEKCSYNLDPSYVVFSAVGSFFLPMLVMLYVYAKISCVIAWRHKSLLGLNAPNDCASHRGRGIPRVNEPEPSKSSRNNQNKITKQSEELSSVSDIGPINSNEIIDDPETIATGTGNQLTVPTRSHREHENNRSSMRKLMRETKTAGTLAIVVGGFVACWLPFFILYLATPFVQSQPSTNLMIALTWLGWINSAINPFIYAFYSKDFRLAFWRLTCSKCSKIGNVSKPSLDVLTDGRQLAETKQRVKKSPNG